MAQQIQKKYIKDGAIDGEKIKLLAGQSLVQESSEGDVELIKLNELGQVIVSGKETAFKEQVEAEATARQSAISSLQSNLTQEISDRQSADSSLQSNIDAEASSRQSADSSLQSAIDVEKGRIDSILLASDADKDSFKEIVDLINSVDTENDSAFAAYVLSNDAALAQEVSDRQSADTLIKEYKPDQILYVSKNGLDTNVGSDQLPFLTLGAALSAISDASPSKRYAIRVGAGSYVEANLSLKPNVFIVGEGSKEAVRIDSEVSLDSSFSGSDDNRSGFSNVLILKSCDFDWDAVTSSAGKLYFSQVVFGSTVNMKGYTSTIAQAQFADCQIFGKLTVSGINISVFHNNICWGDVDLNQHPAAGMSTIFNAIGGTISGNLKATTTGSDFNRRCSAFLKSCFTNSIEIDGAVSYVDVTDDSLPKAGATTSNGGNLVRLNDGGLNKDLSNLSYPTAVNQPILPANTNTTNLGDWNKQWMFNFAYVHGSTGSDLYILSTMGTYDAAGDDTGRTIYIQADSYGVKEDVDGGDIILSTTSVSGTRVRGKISLDAKEIDLTDKQIKNLADGTDATDAVTKQQLDVEKDRIDAILLASDADKDSFKEIVDLINSVDTENDNAFAAYVLSNDAALAQEVSDRQSADSSLQSEIDAAEGRLDSLEARVYKKEKFTLTATDISNGYVDLGFEAREKSIRAFVGRLAMHEGEGEDYTVSVVGGVTRVTFVGNMVTPSEEQLTAGDILHFSYEA